MTLPMIAGFLAVITFEFADCWFVSRLGTSALAALTFSFPVCLTIICLFVGLGIGTGSAVSRAVGRGDDVAARRLATSSLIFSLVLSVLITALGILTLRPFFRVLGAGEELLPGIEAYMTVWYAGVFTVAVPIIAGNALLAVGDARATGLINTFGSVANIVFDPLLIFGWGFFPRWGLAGAAAATVAARFFSSLLSLAVLSSRRRLVAPRLRPFSRVLADWRPTAAVGFPAAATHMVGPVALAVLLRLVSRFGIEAVAAVGVGSRIDPFIFVVFWGLSDVMVVFTGQNLGAGKLFRVGKATSVSMALVLGWGLASAVLLYFLGAGIGRNFSAVPGVVEAIGEYFRIMPWSYAGAGAVCVAAAVFNGLDLPLRGAGLSVLHLALLFVPLAWVGGSLAGLDGIFGGVVASYWIAGAAGTAWVFKSLGPGRLPPFRSGAVPGNLRGAVRTSGSDRTPGSDERCS